MVTPAQFPHSNWLSYLVITSPKRVIFPSQRLCHCQGACQISLKLVYLLQESVILSDAGHRRVKAACCQVGRGVAATRHDRQDRKHPRVEYVSPTSSSLHICRRMVLLFELDCTQRDAAGAGSFIWLIEGDVPELAPAPAVQTAAQLRGNQNTMSNEHST